MYLQHKPMIDLIYIRYNGILKYAYLIFSYIFRGKLSELPRIEERWISSVMQQKKVSEMIIVRA